MNLTFHSLFCHIIAFSVMIPNTLSEYALNTYSAENIVKFVDDSNWYRAQLIPIVGPNHSHKNDSYFAAAILGHQLARYSQCRTNILTLFEWGPTVRDPQNSFTIIVMLDRISRDKELYAAAAARRTKSVLFIIRDFEGLKEAIQEFNDQYLFYICHVIDETTTKWYQTLGIKNQDQKLVQELRFNPGTMEIKEYFNLEGLRVESVTLSWRPLLFLENCDPETFVCDSSGYLTDVFDELERMFNFTTVEVAEMNGDWGVKPKRDNVTGEIYYTGINKWIKDREYPFSNRYTFDCNILQSFSILEEPQLPCKPFHFS